MEASDQAGRTAETTSEVRLLLERLAELLDVATGDTRLEVIFADGRFRYLYKHLRLERDRCR